MATETAPQFTPDRIGVAGKPVELEVTAERIAAYAAATNDPIAAHAAGEIASPVFAVVPAFQAGGIAAFQVIPGELLGAVVHGEQDFHFQRPIEPGMTLSTTAMPIGMRQRSSGVTVVTKAVTSERGEPVVEQYMTTFVRGASGAADVGEEAPGHGFDDSLRERGPDAEVTQTFDADQTHRYASGDPMQIHLDDDFAKAVGLPGIIIHGLCTMAFTSVAVIESFGADDPTRLKRLAVRFARMAFPGQTITTHIWEACEDDGRKRIAYETSSDSGDVVIKDGLAEIA